MSYVLPGSQGRVAPRVAPGHVYSVGPTPGVPRDLPLITKGLESNPVRCTHEASVHRMSHRATVESILSFILIDLNSMGNRQEVVRPITIYASGILMAFNG